MVSIIRARVILSSTAKRALSLSSSSSSSSSSLASLLLSKSQRPSFATTRDGGMTTVTIQHRSLHDLRVRDKSNNGKILSSLDSDNHGTDDKNNGNGDGNNVTSGTKSSLSSSSLPLPNKTPSGGSNIDSPLTKFRIPTRHSSNLVPPVAPFGRLDQLTDEILSAPPGSLFGESYMQIYTYLYSHMSHICVFRLIISFKCHAT